MKSVYSKEVEEWDILRAKALRLQWPSDPNMTVKECAQLCSTSWYETRSMDYVAEFLLLDGRALLKLHGFGRIKVKRFLDIISQCLDLIQDDLPPIPTMRERLAEWGVPANLPCTLVCLPTRYRNYCHSEQLHTIGDVIDNWQNIGYEGLRAQPNLGRRSVDEINSFCNAIAAGDRSSVAQWLPLDPDGFGLSLWIGLLRVVRELDTNHREILEKRIVYHHTLEESAADYGVTRERVRQVESAFIRRIANLLEWFPIEKDSILTEWMEGADWNEPLNTIQDVADRNFLSAALEFYFNQTPQGIARALNQEEMLGVWHSMLSSHSDLLVEGVDLNAFLQEHVPEQMRSSLIDCLTVGKGRIRLDHTSGRVIHSYPKLLKVVNAILAREDDPIPLTWLVELVRQSPSHPDTTREQIIRYRAQWKCDDVSFRWDKILWDQ